MGLYRHFFFKLSVILLILFIINTKASTMKRSKIQKDFPDYSLRYTYPKICETESKHTSGYFQLPSGKNFFFWFFESRSNPKKDPLTLWLNGGPGCSSMLGLFMEVGPCRVNNSGDGLLSNAHSWTNNANMLFLDQPVNSGYSYYNGSEKISDSNAAANDVYVFLQLFYGEFPEFAQSDFHIAGESYAGHFLPAIANTIYHKNHETNNNHNNIPLKSLAIGNGMTDPLTQYQHYKPMACEPSSYGETLVTSSDKCKKLETRQKECTKLIENCYQQTNFTSETASHSSSKACIIATGMCNLNIIRPVIENTKKNIYDIRKQCEDGPMCYDYFTAIRNYLDRSEVKSALGVSSAIKFELCNDDINKDFLRTGDWMRPYVKQLPALLDNGLRVLAFAGDTDFMVNWMGVRAWTMNLIWQGQEDYNSQEHDTDWYTTDGSHAGTIRKSKQQQLAFIRLFNAGHMAPYDQPEATLDMFNRWMSGTI